MSDPEGPLLSVAPLTSFKRDGTPYFRTPEIEAQLAELVLLSPAQIVARARATDDFHRPDYVRDECLAYFLREWHRTGRQDAPYSALASVLVERYERLIRARMSSLDEAHREDACAEVWARLCDLALGALRPGLTLVLDLPPARGMGRALARGDANRYERQGADFHARVRAGFLAIAAAEPGRCAVLDAALPAAEVLGLAMEAVRARLGGVA